MSTPSADTTVPESQNFIEGALKLCGSILALLMGLVILRFAFNICLDCSILDDREGARRRIGEVWRRICPWWHVRTLPTNPQSNNEDIEGQGRHNTEDRDDILASVGHSFNAEILDKILDRVQMDDVLLEELRETSSERGEGTICSICLQELIAGDDVYQAPPCRHVFHAKCLGPWVMRSSDRSCPNCRTPLISQSAWRRSRTSAP